MKRIMVVVVCCGLLLSVAGCTETVNVTSTEAPTTNAPIELRSGFAVNGREIGPEANLRGTNLTDADLTGADLRGANLTDVNLTDANLRGADLSDFNQPVKFSGANLRGANLTNANLSGAQLMLVDLHGANLYSADMRGVDLRGAILRGSDLTSANLSVLTITKRHGFVNSTNQDDQRKTLTSYEISKHADLTGADLTGADLRGANLTGATMPDGSIHD
jgi:uncharacterized protein YjbI with pentapeptide repeats